MNEDLTSQGKCLFCNEIFPQKQIGRHLAKHLALQEKSEADNHTKKFSHILIDSGLMFLHVLVNDYSKMELLDSFLRDIWMDCCGHMSGFFTKTSEISMNQRIKDVFPEKEKILYDYDFGTTTRVNLRVLGHYDINMKDHLTLLSRNEPLELVCTECEKEYALHICTVCSYDEYVYLCKKCAKKHEKICEDFKDYASMPVVNSPRMGDCGYTGGVIDTERDGTFQKK